jgi:hypothetical protein
MICAPGERGFRRGVDGPEEEVYVEGLHRTSCRWRGRKCGNAGFHPLTMLDKLSIFMEFAADWERWKLEKTGA